MPKKRRRWRGSFGKIVDHGEIVSAARRARRAASHSQHREFACPADTATGLPRLDGRAWCMGFPKHTRHRSRSPALYRSEGTDGAIIPARRCRGRFAPRRRRNPFVFILTAYVVRLSGSPSGPASCASALRALLRGLHGAAHPAADAPARQRPPRNGKSERPADHTADDDQPEDGIEPRSSYRFRSGVMAKAMANRTTIATASATVRGASVRPRRRIQKFADHRQTGSG